MNLTIDELKEKLMQFDETVLVELLDLTSADILDRFEDVIQDKYDILIREI